MPLTKPCETMSMKLLRGTDDIEKPPSECRAIGKTQGFGISMGRTLVEDEAFA